VQTRSALSLIALVAIVAACSDSPSSPSISDEAPEPSLVVSRAPEQIMAGEVLVKLKSGASLSTVARAHGLSVAGQGYKNAFGILRGVAGNEHAQARALRGDARVEWAEPNYLRQTTTIDSRLWAFRNPGGLNMKFSRGGSAGQNIPSSYASVLDADEDNIENYAAGGSDVVVGSIDTGVDMTHSEFTGRLIAGKDWYNNDNNPADENGHGTHTSGTMAGTTVGVAGVAGAAAHVKVYVQRVCGKRGCPTSAMASAIRAAADVQGMVAVNVSIGGFSESQAEMDAIDYAKSKNVLVIVSAGNDGTNRISCPACDPDAIAVSATTWQDKLAAYSNYGAGLDIAAPGGYCYSNTTPEGCIYSAYMGNTYSWMQGTSMAAPQVTGTAAIVASVTGLRGTALRDRILNSTDNIGTDAQFGRGRLNSYRAVTGNSLSSGQ
jgi:subtilisin family serine protease